MILFLKGFTQLVILLADLAPSMIKLWQEWQRRNGRLTAEERKRLASTVKESVKSKDTSDLEQFLTGGKLPADKPEGAKPEEKAP